MLERQGRKEKTRLNPGYAVLLGLVYSSELVCGGYWVFGGGWWPFVVVCGG